MLENDSDVSLFRALWSAASAIWMKEHEPAMLSPCMEVAFLERKINLVRAMNGSLAFWIVSDDYKIDMTTTNEGVSIAQFTGSREHATRDLLLMKLAL